MDRLEAMSLLIETMECGSMSAAGRKLNIPLATLSRKLTDLEDHLGVRLLIRSTRRLELTDAGNLFLAASRRILDQMDDAEREATGEYQAPRGRLVLTAPLSFGRKHVLPVVEEFLERHPEVNVRLGLSDHHLDLVGEHVDLAVRLGVLRDSQLIARKVGEMPWVVVASPRFLASHGEPRKPEDLAGKPCVGVDFIHLARWWRFRTPGNADDYTVPITPRLAVTTGEGAVDAAVAGVGLTQTLYYQAASDIAAGRLKVVLADHAAAPLPVSLVYTGTGRMPAKTRRFLDFAAPRIKRHLESLGGSSSQ